MEKWKHWHRVKCLHFQILLPRPRDTVMTKSPFSPLRVGCPWGRRKETYATPHCSATGGPSRQGLHPASASLQHLPVAGTPPAGKLLPPTPDSDVEGFTELLFFYKKSFSLQSCSNRSLENTRASTPQCWILTIKYSSDLSMVFQCTG